MVILNFLGKVIFSEGLYVDLEDFDLDLEYVKFGVKSV